MPNIFDYDGPAYFTAFSEIMERIEEIQNNESNATEQEKTLLNRFYKQLNSSSSSVSRSRSNSRSNNRTKSRSANKSKSVKKNRNKMYRKKKTIKRKQ